VTTIRFDAPLDGQAMARVRSIVAASGGSCAAYFDIDGTLVTDDNQPNLQVLALLKFLHEQGVRIFLWSAGGDENCRRVARRYGLDSMIEACLPKPVISVDDMGYDDYVFVKLHPSDLTPKG
jgi:hypothetical protein